MRKSGIWCSFISTVLLTVSATAQVLPIFPVKRAESAETWQRDGWAAIRRAKSEKPRNGKAKNIILFIGDGMGVSTLTAARILEGQLRGESGEENRLSFEDFPYSALSKTYTANQQTSDSAPTMTAIVTGVKTDEGVISVDQDVVFNDHKSVSGNEATTFLELAERVGKSTGVVSTARLTHATPAACYAHSPSRDWESDKDIFDRNRDAHSANFPDIARQLVEFKEGDGIEVALGGGRAKFLTKETPDPEYPTRRGDRADGQDLTAKWLARYPKDGRYVFDRAGFDSLDPKSVKHVLGLFEPSHMQYEHDRPRDRAGEPSLTEMTVKSIDILSQNKKGYFLMVEGGRVDHAHHDGNAFRALTDTIELSKAVRAAAAKVNLDETLIIVTADHSHTFAMVGYPARGNNILGLVREIGGNGNPENGYKLDALGRPFTTLAYINGPGYPGETEKLPEGPRLCCDSPGKFKPVPRGRPDLSLFDTTQPDYRQEAMIPLSSETHGGEDVAIFATGVNAHLVRGSMEENWIFYVMADAFRFKGK